MKGKDIKMICEDVIKVLQKQSPESYACDWDNVGLLVGSRQKNVKTIYIDLDATDETISEAIEAGADMLLTHHPMIFKGLKKINSDDFIGRRVMRLLQNDIAYYAMHTNFDSMGMADLAADKIGLKETTVLQETSGLEGTGNGIGKVGVLPQKMTLQACAKTVKKAFGLELVKVFGDLACEVERAAICPGSGKLVIEDSYRNGAQVLITGDIDHHEGIDAVACNMCIIDAGHYGLEQIFIPYMKEYLEKNLSGVAIITKSPHMPFTYV